MLVRPLLLVASIALLGCSQPDRAGITDDPEKKERVTADCSSSIGAVGPRVETIGDPAKKRDAGEALARAKEYLASKDEVGCLQQIELVLLALGEDILVRPKN